MKTGIIRIGNSRGIRIPKTVLEQTGISGEVDLAVEDKVITIRSSEHPRAHWDEAFRNMADLEDDLLLDQDHTGQDAWDQDEWQWSSIDLMSISSILILRWDPRFKKHGLPS